MQPIFAPRTHSARVLPRVAAAVAIIGVPLTVMLAFAYAPTTVIGLVNGSVQHDFAQKVFYLHVPLAMAAYLGFAAGAWNGLLHLMTGRADHDIRSYAGVHVGVVFGTLVLLTGSIWAKAAWGVWFQWQDRQLVVFLTLYLFYCAYFLLRYSIDDGRARRHASAIYAVLGVALVPLSFLAIRIATTLIHPLVLTRSGDRLTGPMWVTFFVGIAAFCALALWMMYIETAVKTVAMRQQAGERRVERGDASSPVSDSSEAAPHA